MSKTTRSRDGMYASQGAVRQHEGSLPIYVCNDCGREVVWATSSKTGRKYLANVSTGYLGQRFYIGASVHRCDRSRTPEALEAREIDREIAAAQAYAMQALYEARDAAFLTGTDDEIADAFEAIDNAQAAAGYTQEQKATENGHHLEAMIAFLHSRHEQGAGR